MFVLKSIDQVKQKNFKDTILTIGSFDGVHLGHRQLITKMKGLSSSALKVVMTFDPHPAKVLSQQPPPLLFSSQDQIDVFASLGVDALFFLPFNQQVASIDAKDFIEQLIWPLFQPQKMVVGHDFTFGKDRKGDAALLHKELSPLGTQILQEPPFYNGQDIVSSTLIRRILTQGQIERVQVLLDRPYYIEGFVVEGRKLGRTLGFPTANLRCNNEIFPGTGVYYCQTQINGKTYKAVGNIGFNPTVSNNHNLKIEFYLLDFNGDLYGQTLRFEFLQKLRDEKRFGSKEELRVQIEKDVASARTL